jgi:hypothetical protein
MGNAVQWDERIGRRLKLRDLHIFMTVAQQGSMGRAAKQLAVTAAAEFQRTSRRPRASIGSPQTRATLTRKPSSPDCQSPRAPRAARCRHLRYRRIEWFARFQNTEAQHQTPTRADAAHSFTTAKTALERRVSSG